MATFQCQSCDKLFKYRRGLIAHQRMHNGTAFTCDVCEKRFDRKCKLNQHRIAHTFDKPFACDVDGCEKKFTQKGHMQTHKRAVHECVPGKYQCEQCPDRTFFTSTNLNKHRRTHTGERPFACTDCAMKFAQKGDLQGHYRIKHTTERPYACAHCEKMFATSAHRAYHTRRAHAA